MLVPWRVYLLLRIFSQPGSAPGGSKRLGRALLFPSGCHEGCRAGSDFSQWDASEGERPALNGLPWKSPNW